MLVEKGDLAQAKATLDRAEGLHLADPSWPLAVEAVLAEREGGAAAAGPLYDAARAANPTNWFVDWAQGRGLLETGEPSEAQPYLLSALSAAFEFTDTVDRLGLTALQLGDAEASRRYFEESASREPTPVRMVYVAAARLSCRNPSGAVLAYREASRLAGSDPYLLSVLGLGYVANLEGRSAEAVEYFEDVRAESPYAQAALAAIGTNQRRWQWVDRFRRAPSRELFRKWRKSESQGILVHIAYVDDSPGDATARAPLAGPIAAGDAEIPVEPVEPFPAAGEGDLVIRIGGEWIEYVERGAASLRGARRGQLGGSAPEAHPEGAVDPETGQRLPTWVVRGRRAAVLQGTQVQDWQPTLLGQILELDQLERVQLRLRTDEATGALVGAGIFAGEDPGRSPIFCFGTSWKGDLVYGTVTPGERPQLTTIGTGPVGGAHVYSIVQSDRRRSCDLYLDDRKVAQDVKIDIPLRGAAQVGVVGLAKEGTTWKAVLEEARYVYEGK